MILSRRLSGASAGLLRRGSPVFYRHSVFAPASYVIMHSPAGPVVTIGNEEDGVKAKLVDLTLEVEDPTGFFHALFWLTERGHDLRWSKGEPEALAWSVLSVARGGGALCGILGPWAEYEDGRWTRDTEKGSPEVALMAFDALSPLGIGWRCGSATGEEIGPNARAAADRALLARRYGLRDEKGGLILPELPEESASR